MTSRREYTKNQRHLVYLFFEKWERSLMPKWVPDRVYEMIADFWSQFGRKPIDYSRDIEVQRCPNNGVTVYSEDGSIPTVKTYKTKRYYKKGIFVHTWNNMGAIVFDDGSYQICATSILRSNHLVIKKS